MIWAVQFARNNTIVSLCQDYNNFSYKGRLVTIEISGSNSRNTRKKFHSDLSGVVWSASFWLLLMRSRGYFREDAFLFFCFFAIFSLCANLCAGVLSHKIDFRLDSMCINPFYSAYIDQKVGHLQVKWSKLCSDRVKVLAGAMPMVDI